MTNASRAEHICRRKMNPEAGKAVRRMSKQKQLHARKRQEKNQ
jgi:hypothetical protein